MSNHLSQDQFETCVLGRPGPAELSHIRECLECRTEVERFGSGMALFRRAVHDLAGASDGLNDGLFSVSQTASARIPVWSWTLAGTALAAAVVLPFLISRPKPIVDVQAEMNPEAVMERLNRHLAGTVPEPMEPMLSLISGERPGAEGDRSR